MHYSFELRPNMNQRIDFLASWARDILKQESLEIHLLTGDASLRTYYRIESDSKHYVLMDSARDPSFEQFIAISNLLKKHGIHTPTIIASDSQAKLLILEDFGDGTYFTQLNTHNADHLYNAAIDTLIQIQLIPYQDYQLLPSFNNEFLNQQWDLFTYWFLTELLRLDLGQEKLLWLHDVKSILNNFIEQRPKGFVHLDYHSRNLMVVAKNQVGVLDFQDARQGPYAYDLVSLLQDAYLSWPPGKISQWLASYFEKACSVGLPISESFTDFQRTFDWVALQRHLKNCGIFSRLHLRDGKSHYLNDIPMLLKYIRGITQKYPEFSELNTFFETTISDTFFDKIKIAENM